MAIVKMKKLRLMAIRSNKDALLKELICKGCVEFSEIEGEVQDSDFKELLKRESSGLMTFKSQHMALVNAVGILDRYSPAKKPLLSALPEVGEDVLLDDSGVIDTPDLEYIEDEEFPAVGRQFRLTGYFYKNEDTTEFSGPKIDEQGEIYYYFRAFGDYVFFAVECEELG